MLVAPAALAPIVDLAGTGFVVDEQVRHGADLAVNLHGRGPESTALLASTRPRRLVSYGLPEGPVWRDDEHEVARWCRLLAACGIPADPRDLRLAPPPSVGLDGVTVVHPGASSAARRWPADRWARVAAAEAQAHRRVVVTGDASEVVLAADVACRAGLDGDAVLAGRTDLATLAALVAHAGRVVCGDTGVAHLASAFATPSVVLFGPVPPSAWGPPPGGPHVPLWAGRTGDPQGGEPDPGLLDLSVGQVLAALASLPAR